MSLHGQGAYGSPWQESSQTALTDLDGTIGEMEPLGELVEAGFEPQTRARSNTWPLPRPENYVEPADEAGSKKNSNQHLSAAGGPPIPSPVSVTSAKKNSSRRNAWGNLSYADLITQAITSATDNRLTLSQIYEWMVQNVPYFKDKGDSNSSAGWKNSIRHNLSLHNRFMRVQNEGTGKSSWWMINPDAKPGKSVRRRAASMETSKFEKRRGRVKKKVEALRNGMTADATPSPSSSISEGLDMFPDSPLHSSAGGFQLSPDFRQRASSNASSCGRLSPIPSLLGVEPDWAGGDYADYAPAAGADQLAGSLADTMTLHGTDPFLNTYVPTTLSNGGGGVPSGPPPPYPPRAFPLAYPAHCPRHPRQPCACIHHTMHNPHAEGVGVAGMSPSYPAGEACGDHFMGPPATPPRTPLLPQPAHTNLADLLRAGNPSLLNSQESLVNGGLLHDSQTNVLMSPATTMMGQLMGALNNPAMMEDLNLNIESLEHGGFDCNVDEVIKHELSMDGSLDFNFPQSAPQQGAPTAHSDATSQAGTTYQHTPATVSTAVTIDDTLMTQQRQPTYSAPSWVH